MNKLKNTVKLGNLGTEKKKKYYIIIGIVLVIMAIIPQVTSDYIIYVMTIAMLYAVLAGSYDLTTGYTGPLTFCHGAFYGVGAYTSALLTLRVGFPFWAAFLTSGLLVFAFAVIVGYPALRLKGHYFAVTTFFFAHFMYLVLLNSQRLTQGPLGLRNIPPPGDFFGISFKTISSSYYLIFIFGIVAIGALYFLVNSGIGKILISIRENEELSESIGINTSFYKVLAFSIGAGIAGLTGSLFAHFFRLLHPSTFAWMTSEMVVIMAIVGGLGTLFGPIIGAGVVTLIMELMRFAPELRFIIWSIAIIAVLVIEPKGLMGIAGRLRWRGKK